MWSELICLRLGTSNGVPCRVEDFLTSCATVSFSRTILLCGTVYDVIGARMSLCLKLVVKKACLLFCLTIICILKVARSNLEWDATLSST
jgi:hypothetical protein